jgi:hypothetical protein
MYKRPKFEHKQLIESQALPLIPCWIYTHGNLFDIEYLLLNKTLFHTHI